MKKDTIECVHARKISILLKAFRDVADAKYGCGHSGGRESNMGICVRF